jgi:hypothetical protein
MNDDELINDFVSRIMKGEITFDKIRPLLEGQGLDESRIKMIVRMVDDEIQKTLLANSTSSSADQVIRIGIILLVIGAVFTIGSVAGFFSLGNSYLAIFAYGTLIAGLFLIVGGVKRKKKNLNQGSDPINRSFRLRDKMRNE